MKTVVPAIRRASFLLAACVALNGCVTLIAPYDDKFDQQATDLQRKVSTHIEALDGAEMPACLHTNHKGFYDEARVDASALSVRANSHELNAQTLGQVDALRSSIDTFESLHKLASEATPARCLSGRELSPIRRALDQTLGAIMKLELAKKRGS